MIIKHPVAVQFYLDREEKQAFKAACKGCDSQMSRELRRMIREFIRNPPLDDRLYYQPVSAVESLKK